MRHPARRSAVLGCLLALVAACSPGTGGASPTRTTTTSSKPSAAAPSPAPTSAPSGPEAAVAAALAGMDARAKVAQLFVAGIRLDHLSGGTALAGTGVGGIFLAGRSQTAATDLGATLAGW